MGLPEAGGPEVGQPIWPRVQPILRLAALEHVNVRTDIVDVEPAGRIVLRLAGVQPERLRGELPESDIDQIGPIQRHPDRHVIERRAVALRTVHPRLQQLDAIAEMAEQCPEETVEFVAEAAATAYHDLLEELILVQDDRLAQMDAEVLERHGAQMRSLQQPQPHVVGWAGVARTDPLQIGPRLVRIHALTLEPRPKV